MQFFFVCRCIDRQATINNPLPYRILSGTVIVKSNVESFTETGALFEDGTSVENLDAIIFATGFSFNYPAVEADGSLSMDKRDRRFIFKNVFLPELSKPTLALRLFRLISHRKKGHRNQGFTEFPL